MANLKSGSHHVEVPPVIYTPNAKLNKAIVDAYKEAKFDPQEAKLRLAARLALAIQETRETPLGLYKTCFSSDDGSPVIIKWFHEEWNEMILHNRGVLIEASRGLTKTSFLLAAALWFIGKNKNARIKWLGANDTAATKRLRVISDYIEKVELYHLAFPDIQLDPDPRVPNNVSQLTTLRDAKTPEPTVEAKGVLSSGTGDRCLNLTTMLMSTKGLITAGSVVKGTQLLTHEGKAQFVQGTHRQIINEPMIEVRPYYSPWPIKVTCDHRFLIYRENGKPEVPSIAWVRADELNRDDYLLHPKGISNSTHKIATNKDRQNSFTKLKQDLFVWRFLGYYCAEGWLSSTISGYTKAGNPKKRSARQVNLAFNSDGSDDAHINDIIENSKTLGWNCVIDRSRLSVTGIRINGNATLAWLCSMFGCPAPEKCIPTFIMRSGEETKRQFLLGYWRGDGCKVDGRYIFTSSSPHLAAQTWQLLLDVGILAAIAKSDSTVRAQGSLIKGRLCKPNGPLYNTCAPALAASFLEPERPIGETLLLKPQHGWIGRRYACIPIRSIKRTKKSRREVIGIQVKNSHSHAHPIGITHNSDLIVLDDVCVVKGSPVHTQAGVVKIETIHTGQQVINCFGDLSVVSQVHKRTVDKVITIFIRGQHSEPYSVTPNHPIWASKLKGYGSKTQVLNPEFVQAEELTKSPNRWRLVSPICPSKNYVDADIKRLWSELPLGVKGQHKGLHRSINPLEEPSLWLLIGLWLAEGYIENKSEDKKQKYNNNRVWFSLSKNEVNLFSLIEKICSKILIRSTKPQLDKRKCSSVRFAISDSALYNFLANWYSAEKHNGNTKFIPTCVYSLPIEHKLHLLYGYWLGDGRYAAKNTYQITSTNKELLQQMQYLATSCGIAGSIYKRSESWKHNPFTKTQPFDLYLQHGLADIDCKYRSAGETDKSPSAKRGCANQCPRYTLKTIHKFESVQCPVVLSRFTAEAAVPTSVDATIEVYNLTMKSGHHSYLHPGGLVSHNCDMRNTLMNPALRPQVINKLLSDWLPTLNPKSGRVWDIFTPWADDDANAYFKRNTEWAYKIFAHGKPGNPHFSIFPELFSEKKLAQLHKEEGDLHYARGRLCQAFTKGTVTVAPDSLISYNKVILSRKKLIEAIAILSADPSSGKDLQKTKLDYLGITILLIYLDHIKQRCQIFVPDAYQIKLPLRHQVVHLGNLARIWNPEWVLIESNGMQTLHEWLYEPAYQTAIHPDIVVPCSPRSMPKGQRLMAITPFLDLIPPYPPTVFFHPNVISPNPMPHQVEVNLPGRKTYDFTSPNIFDALRDLRHQLLSFPTPHDDIMDSFTQALLFAKSQIIPPEYLSILELEPQDYPAEGSDQTVGVIRSPHELSPVSGLDATQSKIAAQARAQQQLKNKKLGTNETGCCSISSNRSSLSRQDNDIEEFHLDIAALNKFYEEEDRKAREEEQLLIQYNRQRRQI